MTLTVAWNLARQLTLIGGPSWNVTVSDILDEFGNPIESSIAPWSVFDKTTDSGYNIKMYPGATFGVRFYQKTQNA